MEQWAACWRVIPTPLMMWGFWMLSMSFQLTTIKLRSLQGHGDRCTPSHPDTLYAGVLAYSAPLAVHPKQREGNHARTLCITAGLNILPFSVFPSLLLVYLHSYNLFSATLWYSLDLFIYFLFIQISCHFACLLYTHASRNHLIICHFVFIHPCL